MHINTLNAKLNPICHLLALLGAHHILHVSRIRVKEKSSSNRSIEKNETHFRPRVSSGFGDRKE
jgi:hypothetical protein